MVMHLPAQGYGAFGSGILKGMNKGPGDDIDRLSVRRRPQGWPIMYQSWGKLLFLHWPVPAEALRPHEPKATRSEHSLCLKAHPSSCPPCRIRSYLVGGRQIRGSPAGYAGFLPH